MGVVTVSGPAGSSPGEDPVSGVPVSPVDRETESALYDVVPSGVQSLRRLAEEGARIAGTPTCVISLMKVTTQRALASVGAEVTVLARKDSLCFAIIDEGGPVHVADVSLDERWVDNPFVDGRWGSFRFLGMHPLISPNGVVIGTLSVLDRRPRTLDATQVAELDALALEVVDALETLRQEPDDADEQSGS